MLLEAIRSADRRDWARARDYLRASLELEPIADISRALKRVEVAAHHPDASSVKVDLRLYLGQVLELPDLPFMDVSPGREELSDVRPAAGPQSGLNKYRRATEHASHQNP